MYYHMMQGLYAGREPDTPPWEASYMHCEHRGWDNKWHNSSKVRWIAQLKCLTYNQNSMQGDLQANAL